MLNYTVPSLLIWFILHSNPGYALSSDNYVEDLSQLQKNWATGKYVIANENKKKYFHKIYLDSKKVLNKHPNDAKLLIWHGIIASTYAEVKGGLKALSLVKESKSSLEKAISIEPNALQGSAYTSLGVLYEKVPGWPIGFGNDKKAKFYYETALKMNPNGIDSNYFYGAYLMDHGKKHEAVRFLEKALKAPGRKGRELADKGRRAEIKALLSKIN